MKIWSLILTSLFVVSCASKSVKNSSADESDKSTASAASKETSSQDAKKGTKTTKKTTQKVEPKSGESSSAGDVVCTTGDIKRTLHVTQSSEHCSVEYTKDGSTQEIASGAPNSSFCDEIVSRVKNNLSSAGYQCN